MNVNKIFQLSAAVLGFYVFQKSWQPTENETLKCFHEAGNEYNQFTQAATQRCS